MKILQAKNLEFAALRMKRVVGSRRPGFSLTELLVVLAVLSVLGALLLPAVGNLSGRARMTRCENQLRMIGVAFVFYESDYDKLPPARAQVFDFMDPFAPANALRCISPYLGGRGDGGWSPSVFSCPSAVDPKNGASPTKASRTSYLPNGVPMEKASSASPRPSGMVLAQECRWLVRYNALRPGNAVEIAGTCPGQLSYWHADMKSPTEFYSNVHFEGGNLLWLDGHVEWKKLFTLQARDFGLANGTSGQSGDDVSAPENACYSSLF